MKRLTALFAVCLALAGCSGEAGRLQTEIAAQKGKIAAAQATHSRELARLKELRDSLQINIRQDVALGMDEERAAALEQARLNSQQALEKAEGQNLKRQREYLGRLQERLRTIQGGP